jgi:hypothetical protein
MTAKTRRRLIVGMVAVVFTLPAESILLKALATPNPQQAIANWVAALSPAQLQGAGDAVQAFPFQYRKAILGALPPEVRSRIWRRHIATYIQNQAELTSDAVDLLQSAIALATPAALSAPDDDTRSAIAIAGGQIQALLGRDTADFLLFRLGPPDGTFASAEPVSQRAARYVRSLFVAMADPANDCDCALDYGCSAISVCKDGTGCSAVTSWPACGWFWTDPCNGLCKSGIGGH